MAVSWVTNTYRKHVADREHRMGACARNCTSYRQKYTVHFRIEMKICPSCRILWCIAAWQEIKCIHKENSCLFPKRIAAFVQSYYSSLAATRFFLVACENCRAGMKHSQARQCEPVKPAKAILASTEQLAFKEFSSCIPLPSGQNIAL